MRVFIMHPEKEDFLSTKSTHFTEDRRDDFRVEIALQHDTPFVWFEDEGPPDLFIKIIVLTRVKMYDWFECGQELADLLDEHVKQFPMKEEEPPEWLKEFCDLHNLDPTEVLSKFNGEEDWGEVEEDYDDEAT